MRVVLLVACTLLALALDIGAALARRVALVIGNGDYQHADKLANPTVDAQRMRAALARLGFEVLFGENLDKRALERMVGRFANATQDAEVALVFFAGHGATFGDVPYVVPTDARFSSIADMPYELLPVETLIGELRRAKGVRIAILDACRDNAAERQLKRTDTRGGETTRGLARPKNPEGLILAYATQYLATAKDGRPNENSPFTAALLDHIATPGLDIKDLFFRVGREVMAKTKGEQRPEISVSFYDDYALVPAGGRPTDVAAASPPVTPTRPPGSGAAPAVGVYPEAPKPAPGVTALSAERERALRPKDTFKECDACPEMVVVPQGSFMMGSPATEKGRFNDEGPQLQVTFSRPFAAGRFAVTFEEWDACVAGGGCGHRPNDRGLGRGRLPVIDVSWHDAKDYVAWLSRKTGRTYRLLSEAEREYAARAGTTTPFWFGSSISPSQANYDGDRTYGNGIKGENRKRTVTVDLFEPNPFGLHLVHGNVWEWTEDCWNDGYKGAPSDGSARTTAEGCGSRVMRGGSWNDGPELLRSATRSRMPASVRIDVLGLRVARTLTPR